jgi:hypothetical protein
VIDVQRPGRGHRGPSAPGGAVLDLDRARIERALAVRGRYKYVQPRVVPEGGGWKIVSPNCSRNVDTAGGEIDIAWLEPDAAGRWQLHARDHARTCWVPKAGGLTLAAALDRLCADPMRDFWQ